MKPIEILKRELIGTFISGYRLCDSWGFCLGKNWLLCQNVIFKEEDFLKQLVLDNYELSKETIDKDFLGKSVAVTSNLRKVITDINLDNKYNLTIEFENGSNMLIPTNEEIVDWQWCINESGKEPYQDCLIACFWEGEIEMGK